MQKMIYGFNKTISASEDGTQLQKKTKKWFNVDMEGRDISTKNITCIFFASCAIIHLLSTEVEFTIFIPLSNIHMEPNNEGTLRRTAIDNATLHLKLCKSH
jgi:hypothetical protein